MDIIFKYRNSNSNLNYQSAKVPNYQVFRSPNFITWLLVSVPVKHLFYLKWWNVHNSVDSFFHFPSTLTFDSPSTLTLTSCSFLSYSFAFIFLTFWTTEQQQQQFFFFFKFIKWILFRCAFILSHLIAVL